MGDCKACFLPEKANVKKAVLSSQERECVLVTASSDRQQKPGIKGEGKKKQQQRMTAARDK